MRYDRIITLTTDFGLNDHYVGTMKGVILDVNPDAKIVDICHSVQAYDVLDGAIAISQAYNYFPSDTVHVIVVDPGVGTARRPILVTTERHKFLAPDDLARRLTANGLRIAHMRGIAFDLEAPRAFLTDSTEVSYLGYAVKQ